MAEKQYLDDNGNPIKSQGPAPKQYLDDLGNPVTPTQPPPPKVDIGTIGPAPRGAGAWLTAAEGDLRHGGRATFVGDVLGRLQGRGDKGYTGLESGTSPGAAEYVGSFPLGAVKAAQGIAETPEHPIRGPFKAAAGTVQALTLPMAFAGGPTAEAVANEIPSRAWAGKVLDSVMQDAGNVPVRLSRSGDAILRAKELSDAGTSMPQAIGKLLARVTRPKGEPLTYSEARDFYSNISRLSADEIGRLNPIMKRQVAIILNDLRQDIGDAAAQVGRASDYYASIKEYANAAKLGRAAQAILKGLGWAGGVGAGIEAGRWGLSKLSPR